MGKLLVVLEIWRLKPPLPFDFLCMYSPPTLVQNCRGVRLTHFLRHLTLLVRKYPCSILVPLEIRVDSSFASKIMTKTSFTNIVVSKAYGFSGGIWVYWDSTTVSLDCISIDDHMLLI